MKKGLAVLEEPKINHNLNLSMTTSDLIELYIEENLQKLENQYNKLIENLHILNETKNSEEKKEILKYYKKIKLPFKVTDCNFYYGDSYDNETITLKWFNHRITDQSISEFAKDRYNELRECGFKLCNNKIWKILLTGDDFELIIKGNSIPESLQVIGQIKEKSRKTLIEKSKIHEELYKIKQTYLEINNTRKVKAKFTKKALANTTEGSKILEFLSTIDSIKALS